MGALYRVHTGIEPVAITAAMVMKINVDATKSDIAAT